MQQIQNAVTMLKTNKTGVIKLNSREILAVTPNALVLRTTNDQNRVDNNFEELLLAIRVNGNIIANSSAMRTKDHKDITNEFQRPLQDLLPMIPFEAMKQAGLSLKNYQEVEKGNEQTVFVKQQDNWCSQEKFDKTYSSKLNATFRIDQTYHTNGIAEWNEPRHFTGARLFSVGDAVFLMDIDQNEIKHGIFNAFLVKLKDTSVKTIAEAYESLKPQAVKDAQAQGLNVLRQGEWFFIPSTISPLGKAERMDLRAGNNRPNHVQHGILLDGVSFVRGEISHAGREHKTIVLDSWYVATANTSIESWQLTGDID